MTWIPEKSSEEVENLMEKMGDTEEDKDEIRKFSEFLRRRKSKKEGKEFPPMMEEMKN